MAQKAFSVKINGTTFDFRKPNLDEFVAAQDLIGNPQAPESKLGSGLRLLVQSCCMNRDSGLQDALNESPGAIIQIGGKLYTLAQANSCEFVGE